MVADTLMWPTKKRNETKRNNLQGKTCSNYTQHKIYSARIKVGISLPLPLPLSLTPLLFLLLCFIFIDFWMGIKQLFSHSFNATCPVNKTNYSRFALGNRFSGHICLHFHFFLFPSLLIYTIF